MVPFGIKPGLTDSTSLMLIGLLPTENNAIVQNSGKIVQGLDRLTRKFSNPGEDLNEFSFGDIKPRLPCDLGPILESVPGRDG